MLNNQNQILENSITSSTNKTKFSFLKLSLASFLGGIAIAIGASSSTMASFAIDNPSLSKLIAGLVFPVGLMLIVALSLELFTGDVLISMAVLDKKAKLTSYIKILVIVFFFNFLGGIFFSILNYYAGGLNYLDGKLASYVMKVGITKTNLGFVKALISGILCNMIVCFAVLFSLASKDISGKILACLFPIMAFVILGFEHSVANMYYLPSAFLASTNQGFVETFNILYPSLSLDSLSISSILLHNLLPVTLGNIIGGLIVGVSFYFTSKNKTK